MEKNNKWKLTKPGFASLLRKRIALFIRLARQASINREQMGVLETQYLVGQADAVAELAFNAGIITYQQYYLLLAASNEAIEGRMIVQPKHTKGEMEQIKAMIQA
jgi:hypothetical protein